MALHQVSSGEGILSYVTSGQMPRVGAHAEANDRIWVQEVRGH